MEESVKNLFSPGMLFEELGFRYFGPIDGHDLQKLCDTLRVVRGMSGPRVIHVHDPEGQGILASPRPTRRSGTAWRRTTRHR